MNQPIVVNTLEFQKELQSGVAQASLFERIANLGATGVEVRREYITDFDQELANIKANSQKFNLTVFYSVPDEVFVNGKLNDQLPKYLAEGTKMGITAIKFNTGDYANFHGDLKATLDPIVSTGIQVNVENDQTQVSGTIAPLQNFLQAVKDSQIDLGYVYDLGNWRYVGENEITAAQKLGEFTRYIHLKDVQVTDGKPAVTPLDDGELDWHKVLNILPKDLPIAIEYPSDSDAIVKAGIEKVEAALAN
ncbi:sugar phosphate isomerase/epimerase family protein [Lentilactobacillus senioris]|uniref:sugar phosphate isomerase/epimerase family protein n=1 Tax=Lentilactobacillus senioris TaxID=931534 RepID=UPI003D27EB8D